MKVSKWFNSTFEMIIYIIVFILLLLGFIYFGSMDYTNQNIIDKNGTVDSNQSLDDNVFDYVNSSDIYNYIKNSNVLILFGIKNNEWVNKYASIINEVAKEVGVTKIYYYDMTEDRNNLNGTYEAIVEYLDGYVTYLDDNTKNIYAPTFFVKIDGVVSLYDDETAIKKGNITVDEYWNNYNTNIFKEKIRTVLKDYKEHIYE